MQTEILLCIVLKILDLVNSVEAGYCAMPNGKPGNCIPISECKPIADIYNKKQVSHMLSRFIKMSSCFDSRSAMNSNSFGPYMYMNIPYAGIRMQFQKMICCPPVYMWDNFLPTTTLYPLSTPQQTTSTIKPVPPVRKPVKNPYEHRTQDGLTICGLDSTTSNKIIGGKATNPYQYPWLALLQYSDGRLKCGGSLITSRFILTAAHCAFSSSGSPVLARLGEYNISSYPTDTIISAGGLTEEITVTIVPVEDTYSHPLYYQDRSLDIGLVKLSRNVEFSDMIQVICVPRTNFVKEFTTDTRFVIAGWGDDEAGKDFSDVKKDVVVPFVPMDKCKSVYKDINSKAVLIDEYQICAGGEEGKDTCKGDSGSPLMYQIDKSFIAVGVTSFGPDNCGVVGQPAVYTNVFKCLGWIQKKIAESMQS